MPAFTGTTVLGLAGRQNLKHGAESVEFWTFLNAPPAANEELAVESLPIPESDQSLGAFAGIQYFPIWEIDLPESHRPGSSSKKL